MQERNVSVKENADEQVRVTVEFADGGVGEVFIYPYEGTLDVTVNSSSTNAVKIDLDNVNIHGDE